MFDFSKDIPVIRTRARRSCPGTRPTLCRQTCTPVRPTGSRATRTRRRRPLYRSVRPARTFAALAADGRPGRQPRPDEIPPAFGRRTERPSAIPSVNSSPGNIDRRRWTMSPMRTWRWPSIRPPGVSWRTDTRPGPNSSPRPIAYRPVFLRQAFSARHCGPETCQYRTPTATVSVGRMGSPVSRHSRLCRCDRLPVSCRPR